jgi:WD40 repeat protein
MLITILDGADFIAISPDNTLIVSASGLDVKLWDIQTGKLVRAFNGHSGTTCCIAFSPSGNSVASGSRDQTISIWDLSSGRCEAILECKSWVRSVRWCMNENLILYGLDDGTFNIGDVSTKTCIKTIPGHLPWSSEISPDRLRFASGSDDGMITIYDTQTLNPLKTFPFSGCVWSVSFSTAGDQIVYLGGDGVHMLDLQRESIVNIVFGDLSDLILSAVLSPDGSTVASTSHDSIKIWQCEESMVHQFATICLSGPDVSVSRQMDRG